MLYKFCQKT